MEESKNTVVQEAWHRFLNGTHTGEDLLLIRNSLKDEDGIKEFDDISEKEWQASSIAELQENEEDKREHRFQAARLLTEYECKTSVSRMKSGQNPFPKSRHLYRRYFIAASIALLGILVPLLYFILEKTSQEVVVQYVEVQTERGEIKTFYLPDNTKVTLNANSSIKYPAAFVIDKRLIEMKGEVLFDVTPDTGQPFVVMTGKTKVEVLGTVFDIKAYEEDNLMLISVESGKVAVDISGKQTLLEKNEQLKFDKTTGKLLKLNIDAEKFISWVDKTLYFNHTPIQEVVNTLNRYYPQWGIELENGNYPNLISGEHDNKSIEAILTSIAYSTKLKYKKENKKIIIYQ